ncbi:MAG: cysteine desulfurase [Bdellovibrionaceae bacterium]|nr:cysteine desulfurase [Bdellovibrionales bacterium]MCB9254957.1 cysteine desulfurase [Pseudobdellovibrionaceae bacterium]
MEFEIKQVRSQFPILAQEVHGKPLVYLDSAATAQKPLAVLSALDNYYEHDNANIHRGVHTLSERATAAYESVRRKVKDFINARDAHEVVFVRGTTEAVNLVAQSFVRPRLSSGDEILITWMEHHSNIVPWQMLCEQTGALLKVLPMNQDGELELEKLDGLLGAKTKFFAFTHVSNALGTINPVKEMVERAHALGVPVLVDGAQAIHHLDVDVQDLGADFYAFSGHKMYGPTGIGVLYGRRELLEDMVPYQGGGEMIRSVTFSGTTYNSVPHKFEAGTPHIAGVVGLGAAIDFLRALGLRRIRAHEEDLLEYGTKLLKRVHGVRLIGTARRKSSVLSFVLEGIHPHDIGTILDQHGVAVRTGHHCAQPVMDFFKIPATTRASLAMYNTREDLDALATALEAVKGVFA